MRFHEESLEVRTKRKLEVIDVTDSIKEVVMSSSVTRGIMNLWVAHTTACLSVNEHDKALWEDLITAVTTLIPVGGEYRHKPNAHAHILSTLIKPGVTIPLRDGEMRLGTWQSILLIELDGPRVRKIDITFLGE